MSIDFAMPYASRRAPVMAGDVVVTSQPLATQAGIEALRRGGNAVDAALAAAITLTVVEPTGNGVGSDAFAIVWDGTKLRGINGSGRAPRSADAASLDGRLPVRGWSAVTVPGAVSTWVALSEELGLLPFAELFEAGVRYADEGFCVTQSIAARWAIESATLSGFDEFSKHFLPEGRAPATGETFRSRELARTLERIAATTGEAFYQGELAEAMVADAKRHGVGLTLDDLAGHSADWVETVSLKFQGVDVHELPPNGQGLATLIMLGIFERHPACDAPLDSADSLHLQIEAMKLALADVYRYVADPEAMSVAATDLLDDGYLHERARLIDMTRASDPGHGTPRPGGTVYLAAADRSGMMVSYIQSNYQGFGSGIVVPGTGISMQNRGAGFSLDPRHPNYLQGGKRPFHTIMPGMVTRSGSADMSFGVMGGPMQPQGHAQAIIRSYLFGQNPQAVADAPRWRVVEGLTVAFEDALPADVVNELARRGHRVAARTPDDSFAFGGAQLIRKWNGGYIAGSDPRKDGQAAGF